MAPGLPTGGGREVADGRGAVAVVTGASKGNLGGEVAAGLCHCGYSVVVATRSRERGEALVAELRASGGRAEFVELHADRPESAVNLAAHLGDRPCAILVNNAGVMGTNRDLIFKTNLMGPTILTLALLPALKRYDGTPRVVNVASSSHLRAAKVGPRLGQGWAKVGPRLGAKGERKLGVSRPFEPSLGVGSEISERQARVTNVGNGVLGFEPG